MKSFDGYLKLKLGNDYVLLAGGGSTIDRGITINGDIWLQHLHSGLDGIIGSHSGSTWLLIVIRDGWENVYNFQLSTDSGTNWYNLFTIYNNGTASLGSNTVLSTGNSSVSKSGETLTVNIGGTSYSLTNTWRGIQNNLTSDSTTDSLSAALGKALNNKFSNYFLKSGDTANWVHSKKYIMHHPNAEFSSSGDIRGRLAYEVSLPTTESALINTFDRGSGIYLRAARHAVASGASHIALKAEEGIYLDGPSYYNGTEIEKVGHTLSYTTLTGSGTTVDQVIVSTGTANGWTLKTLGSLAFSNNALNFYSLYGGNLYGDINFAHVSGSTPAYILANSGTNRLRMIIWDGQSLLFEFQYSDDTGSTWPSAFTIYRDAAKIGSNTVYHTGNLPAYPTKSSWNYDDRYLKLIGGTLSGNIKFSNSPGNFLWESGSWYQRISIYDSGSTTAKVFSFEESQGYSGNSWTELFAIYGNGTVTANIFSGNLSGNADTATKLKSSVTIYGHSFDGTNSINNTSLENVFERFLFSRENWNYIIVPANNGNLGFNVGSAGTSLSYLRMCITNGGNIGIGTASPAYKLDVKGNVMFECSSWGDLLHIYRSDGANNALITYRNTSGVIGYIGIAGSNDSLGSGAPVYQNASGSKYLIYHSGNLPAYPTKSSWNYDDRYLKLTGGTLSGDLNFSHASSATDLKITSASGSHYLRIRIRDGYDDTFYFEYSTDSGSNWATYACIKGSGTYAPNFYTTSDARKKQNIHKISDNIKQFEWKETGETSYGFVAQDLEVKHPELVNDDGNMKTVNYNAALSLVVAKLENRVKELEAKLGIEASPYI